MGEKGEKKLVEFEGTGWLRRDEGRGVEGNYFGAFKCVGAGLVEEARRWIGE